VRCTSWRIQVVQFVPERRRDLEIVSRQLVEAHPKVRFAPDSVLEGDGFELSVPGRAIWPFGRGEDDFQ
jgi:hypothetical protein